MTNKTVSVRSQMWLPPPHFESAAQEQRYRAEYCLRFAADRRLAIALGICVTVVYLIWSCFNLAADPGFRATLEPALWNCVGASLQLVPFLALALHVRFERDERYATTVLVTGCLLNFAFYGNGFILAPYPYDYMYFFIGMLINIIFGFAMLRLRARAVLLLMLLSLGLAVLVFAWNLHAKQTDLASPTAKIYHWAALSYLLTVALIGFVVANLLERTTRSSFLRAEELAFSNQMSLAHSDSVDALNKALRIAVDRAEHESAARARVLASASHDLRQPLHALSMYSALLVADDDIAPRTLREVVTSIEQIARSLGALMHGLLDLSQLSGEHYVSERQNFALDELVAKVCDEFDAPAALKGLALRRELSPVCLHGDAMAVARIVRNLLDNAVKYTDVGGVTVRLVRDRGHACVQVVDTGPGIPESEHVRVFEEFYQLGNGGRDRALGLGLGLAVVQRLVHLAGASITLRSAPEAGSCFELTLPGVLATPRASGAPANTPHAPHDVRGRLVFIVDDEADILHSMSGLLNSWGCVAHIALDAAQTENLFDCFGPPDLLIADLRLRGSENGVALAQRMRRTHGPFPVLFVTGETSSEALRAAQTDGARLLHKPIGGDTLRQAIGESAARRQG